MERLTSAENNHLLMENASLRRQFNTCNSKNALAEYEDLIAALTIAEIQRERMIFLQKELAYVNERKQNLIEEEKRNQLLKSIENNEDLESRLEVAGQKKIQLENELHNFDKKTSRELSEIKLQAARQNASLLSNL